MDNATSRSAPIRTFQREGTFDRECRPGLSEQSFGVALDMEKRRTERSGAFLILASVRLTGFQIENDQSSLALIARTLISAFRRTDVVGWSGAGSIINVLFTEIRGPFPEDRFAILETRMKLAIRKKLPSEVVARVRISIDAFPESEGHSASPPLLGYALSPSQKTTVARAVKRALDIVVSLTILALCWPGLLILIVCVRVTSSGPAIFKQTRIGKHGHKFTLLKLRTMFHNTDSMVHEQFVSSFIENTGTKNNGQYSPPTYKLVNDSRITPLGRFLRRTSLDEFPQFVNVLRGDMSLVGPRPPLPYEFERYKPWHRRRVLDSIPGITGLWQVEGRSRLSFDDAVRLDLQYIHHWSLWLDLKILLKTPRAVLSGKGAY